MLKHRVPIGILVLWFFGILLTSGCGGPNAAQVKGLVTLDETPLRTGTVTFHPQSGNGAIAYGQIDSQGQYELSTGTDAGLAPGAYLVTVSASEEIPPRRPNDEPSYRPLTPGKYGNTATTDLKFEVNAGANELPLKLKSK